MCPIHRTSISSLLGSVGAAHSSCLMLLLQQVLSFSLLIYCNLYCNTDAAFKTVRWLDRFTSLAWLIPWPKLMSIDIDDERYTMSNISRASISVPSLAARFNPALVTCCFCKSSVSLFLLDYSSHPPISPYLSDCMLLVNVTRSRSPTKNL